MTGQVTEHTFASTQPLEAFPGKKGTTTHSPGRRYLVRSWPRTGWGAFAIFTRVETASPLIMPALCGAMLAWWQFGQFDLLTFLFTMAGVITTVLGFNALTEYLDYRHGAHLEAPAVQELPITGFSLMLNGVVAPEVVKGYGQILLLIGFVCSLWLAFLAGWPILFFSGVGFLFGYVHLMLPMGYGYRGWGSGEITIFFAYGLLPIIASYYAQAHAITWLPLWVAFPLGLSAVLIFFNYNLSLYRRDWLMRKRTLNINLGINRAIDLSAVLSVSVYVAILLIVSLTYLPLWTLAGLAPLPLALRAFSQTPRGLLTSKDGHYLYRTTISTTVQTGLLFSLALWIDKML